VSSVTLELRGKSRRMKPSTPNFAASTELPVPGGDGRDPSPVGAGWVGDLLLRFGGREDDSVAGRTGAGEWSTLATDPSWRLLACPTGPGWTGFPARAFERDGRRCWLLGELYGPLAGRVDLGAVLDEVVTGRRRANELNGHFLLWAWDEATRRWEVWTDRFGTIHAYFATDGPHAAIATFFPSVAAATKRQLDWVGLSGFFACGFFPGDRTFFEGVKILRPATHYRFDERGVLLSAERYRAWSHKPDRGRSYADTVAEFGRILGEVMADLTNEGRTAVPISGGLDSRSTVAALPNGDGERRLWFYSYGYTPGSVETSIARRVAEARHLAFESLTIGPYLFDRLGTVLGAVEGFQDLTQCRQAAISGELARHADYVIAAHWGDVWLDDMGTVGNSGPATGEALVEHALHKVEKRGRDWLLDEVVGTRLGGQRPEELLREWVRQELTRIGPLDDPDFRIKAFKTDQWSFRWTLASLRSFQLASFPRVPFYDTRMADFFETVPTEFVAGRRLQINYLKRYAPDLARVTWQARGANLYCLESGRLRQLMARAAAKAWRVARRERVIQRNWEVQFRGDEGRRGLESWLMKPGLKLHEFVAPQRVRGLLDVFAARPDGSNGYTVCMLLTFSAWLEHHG
jgi:asparagine synthase (glutamine-hydrolysing)